MQVANIECQIAQAQLRRYLTGEEMPTSIVSDLETHLRHCPDCMAAAQSLRESLKGVLQAKVTGKPVPKVELPKVPATEGVREDAGPQHAPTKAVVESPADILDAPDSQFRPKKAVNKSQIKTLLYSSALAVLLILMSTVFKDPTTLFGPRASSVKKDTPPVAETSATEPVKKEPSAKDEGPKTGPQQPATVEPPVTEPDTTGAKATATKPLQTDGIIVADGVSGTQTIKTEPPKQDAKPQPKSQPKKNTARRTGGGSTIKVYPPDN
jgi:hypothetical protein